MSEPAWSTERSERAVDTVNAEKSQDTHVSIAVNATPKLIAETHELVSALERRLVGVTRGEECVPERPSETMDRPYLVPLADQITQTNLDTHRLNDRLRSILDRLEV